VARSTLARIGARAIKPLLDALLDKESGQQRTAIEVLGFVNNRNAAVPLFAYATGAADQGLRVKAMTAAASLASPDLLPRLEELFAGKLDSQHDGGARATLPAATWAAVRSGDRRALPLLAKLRGHENAEVRAIATLGSSLIGDEKAVATLGETALDESAPVGVRTAALLGLAARAPATLGKLTTRFFASQNPFVKTLYLGLYAHAAPAVRPSLVEPLLSEFVLADGDTSARALAEALSTDEAPSPLLRSLRAAVLADLDLHSLADLVRVALPVAISTNAALPLLLDKHRATLTAACAKGISGGRADATLTLLDEALQMQPHDTLFHARLNETLASLGSAIARKRESGSAHAPTFRLLARTATASHEAADALVKALAVRSEAAAIAIESMPSPMPPVAEAPVAQRLAADPRWEVRQLAAMALAKQAGEGRPACATVLTKAAKEDPFAIVRDAALQSLDALDHADARRVAALLAASDPEPMVRARAAAILEKP
jgi:HEAT repeat protein